MFVQSFSRSVVSWRSAVKLAALTGTLGLGASAHASDATPQTSKQPQQLVQYDTSKPGILVIDGSDNKTFLPLREESRSFASEEEYFAFIHSVLNFEGDDDKSLTVYQVGQLYTYTPDLQNIIPVTDPIATIIGGRNGVVHVAGKPYCVDPDRCPDPVSVVSLRHEDVYLRNSALLSQQEIEGSVQDASILAMTTNESSNYFTIEAYLSHSITTIERDPIRGHKYYAETVSRTSQIEGGLQVVEAYWAPPRLECEGSLLIDRDPTCYHVPETLFIVESQGHNVLQAAFLRVAADLTINGYCRDWEHSKQSPEAEDVPFIEVRDFVTGWGDNFASDIRFKILPTWIYSTSIGRDPRFPNRRAAYGGVDLRVNQTPDCVR